jgi:hypothetical protein
VGDVADALQITCLRRTRKAPSATSNTADCGLQINRHNHRRVAGDSDLAQAITVTARTHQNLVWTRQRQVNQLRDALRAYYPGALAAFGADLANPEALEVLTKSPSPELGRRLSTAQIRAALRRAGRQRNLDKRAAAIRDALRAPQLAAPDAVADAYRATATALLGVIAALSAQIAELEAVLVQERLGHHSAAFTLDVYGHLQPGLQREAAERVARLLDAEPPVADPVADGPDLGLA